MAVSFRELTFTRLSLNTAVTKGAAAAQDVEFGEGVLSVYWEAAAIGA